ncbi:hypothetical protein ABZO35_02865 [Burkholderia pseudomallei]|uniref:hypothetical protein n=1 Tax=Burkholderia pseudomallei TaxID=28450 RepID=UPI00344B8E61
MSFTASCFSHSPAPRLRRFVRLAVAMRGGLARFDSLRFVAASWAARGRFAAAQPQFSRVWAHRPSHAPLAVRAAADRAAAQTQPHQSHTAPPVQTVQTVQTAQTA